MSDEAARRQTAEQTAALDQIDQLCDRFEAECKAGGQPRIEDYLKGFSGPNCALLLRELLGLELFYQRKSHQHPQLDEFRRRFPEHAETVEAVFHSGQETVVPTSDSSAVDGTRSAAGSRFQVLRFHRSGGLGQVWVARDERLHRNVALKELLERHADDPGNRSRFVTEAEITGALEHPGVVPVYDSGQYEDGRPYYAMRFIRGDSLKEAIQQYHEADSAADDPATRKLELRKLLARFNTVCNTVHYAHSHGVLHRDLKPDNIMLGRYGETLVLDWGLAKSGGDSEQRPGTTESTLFCPPSSGSHEATRVGSVLGTPAYMSPEQAAGELDELGPASDIYSLGATLYCLLCGSPPQTSKNLGAVLENVKQGKFPRPRELKRDLPKPLEAICLKAMALGPADRYATAEDLALDVERWLADETLSAYEEPRWQKAARWARRHRGLVQAAAAGLIVLTIASLVASVLIQGARQGEVQALVRAKKEAAASNQMSNFVLSLFGASDPIGWAEGTNVDFRRYYPPTEEMSARKMLDVGAERIQTELADQPEIRAKVMDRIGSVYHAVGQFDKSVQMLRETLDLRREILPSDHPDLAASLHNLAWALMCKGDFEEAIPFCREARSLREIHPGEKLGDLTSSMHNLALLLTCTGQYEEAEPLYRDALRIRREQFGDEDQAVAISLVYLATMLLDRGNETDEKEARICITDAWTIFCKQTGRTPGKILTELQRGEIDLKNKRFEEAERCLGKIPPEARKLLGDWHPFLAWMIFEHGRALQGLDRFEQAEKAFLKAEEICTRTVRSDHPKLLVLRTALADNYAQSGNYEKSIAILENVLNAKRRRWGEQSAEFADTLQQLGEVYRKQGQLDDAVRTHRRVLEIARKISAKKPRTVEKQMELLARCLSEKGEHAEAETTCSELLAHQQGRHAGDAVLGRTLGLLGAILREKGDPANAQRNFRQAEELLLRGYESMRQESPDRDKSTEEAVRWLVELYEAWEKPEKAAEYRKKLPETQP